MIRTLFCGFGPAAQSAATFLLRHGQPASSMQVMEADPERSKAARSLGLSCGPWLYGDTASLDRILTPNLTRIVVDLNDDAATERTIRRVRMNLPDAVVAVVLTAATAVPGALACGASIAVNEASIAGKLLAQAAVGSSRDAPSVH